jgi:hypothetical protein
MHDQPPGSASAPPDVRIASHASIIGFNHNHNESVLEPEDGLDPRSNRWLVDQRRTTLVRRQPGHRRPMSLRGCEIA